MTNMTHRIDGRKSLRPAVIALAVAFGLVSSACSTARTRVGGEDSHVVVSLSEFKIAATGIPASGKIFEVSVTNNGKIPHSMAVESAGKTVVATSILDGGQSSGLSVPSLTAGTYKLFCTVPGHRAAGMEAALVVGGSPTSAASSMSPQEMERAEEAKVKAFPAKTEGLGGQVLKPQRIGGIKVFNVAAKVVRWEVAPGEFVDGYGYNGQIPGPEIHVLQGDKIKVVLHNELPESTVIHFHGLTLPNAMDGVPFITQPPVRSGETFTYAFTVAEPPGTYMYHSHENATEQVGKGLLGAFIIDSKNKNWDVAQTMVLGDGPLGFTLNGKAFPATAPIVARLGQSVLVRFMNEGQMLHPMHLHGFHFTVIATDGRPVAPYMKDTLVVAPGERYDVLFTANNPGIWAFHCHILSHVEGPTGMFGMVTAVIVK